MTDLIAHTGSVHGRTRVILVEGRQEAVPRQYPSPDVEASASALVDWFEDGLRRLCAAFAATDPSTALWSISQDRTAGFWLLRMALETVLHRVDAEEAMGNLTSLDPDLAVCGIDELAKLYFSPPSGAGLGSIERTVLLVNEDRPARWLFSLAADGHALSRTEATDADAVLASPGSDLYLALTGRRRLSDLSATGEPEAIRSLATVLESIPDAKR